MKLASYKTERGAAKYAGEIMRKFSSVQALPALLPDQSFRYGVKVTTDQGNTAFSGKRPVNYGAGNPTDIMQGNFRIPNTAGL